MPALPAANRARTVPGRRARIVAGYAALAATMFVAAFLLAPLPHGEPGLRPPGAPGVLERPVPLDPFILEVAGGGAGSYTRERLLGRWTLMYFGYSRCPDLCQPALETLRRVAGELAARHEEARIERVFVTVDPAQDTPARLRHYAAGIDPSLVAVHGSERAIAALARQAGILYARRSRDAQDDYIVDHPAVILLIDPQARLRAGFLPPHDADRMVEEIVEMEPAFAEAAAR